MPINESILENLSVENLLEIFEILVYFWKKFNLEQNNPYAIVEHIDLNSDSIIVSTDKALMSQNSSIFSKTIDIGTEKVKILDFLVENNLIKREERERVFKCPVCGSFKLRIKILCPYCGSSSVLPTRIVQHKICGYSAPEIFFLSKSRRVCPNCKIEIRSEDELNYLGRTFYCEDCRRTFQQPKYLLACLNTNTLKHESSFTFEPIKASYEVLYRYAITSEGINTIEKEGIIPKVVEKAILSDRNLTKLNRISPELIRANPKLEFIKDLSFTSIFYNNANGKIVLFDYAPLDPVPILIKSIAIARTGLPYVLVTSVKTQTSLLTVEDTIANNEIINLSERSVSDIISTIKTLLQ